MRFVLGLVGAMAIVAATGGQALAAQAASAPPPVTVSELEVTAPADVRLTVATGGDMDLDTYVSSAPVGLNCGGANYRYTTRQNRQCWLWARRNSQIILTAQSSGGYGTAWTVAWVGCEPIGNGAACVVSPKSETQVAALFTRRAAQ